MKGHIKMKSSLISIVAAIAIFPMAARAEAKSATLAVTGYTGTETLSGFQALVKLSEGVYGFSYADCEAENGGDIWFEDASGAVIPHEVDSWDASGDSFVWVKIPEVLPSTDANFPTAITMHWGDTTEKASHTCTTTDTWSGYAGVWHMNGTVVSGTAQNETDATGHGLDAVPKGVYGSYNLSAMSRGSGIVGNGRVNQTADSYVQGLKVPDYSAYLTDASQFTISGWWSATALNTYPRFATSEGTSNYWAIVGYNSDQNSINRWQKIQGIYSNGESGRGKSGSVTDVFAIDSFQNPNWVYLTVVWDGTTVTAYSNGSQKYTKSNMVAQTESDTGFMIGCAGNAATKNPTWRGYYDEVRMYDGVASASRAKADYDTMNTPKGFLKWQMSAGDSYTLTEDTDWLVPAEGVVIDMNGYNLTLADGFGGAAMITNSAAGDAKELRVTFASATENTATALGGNILFVKDGAGTFTSSKAQTYTGGTIVAAGTAQPPKSTSDYDASFTVFGTGKITVNSNAVFNAQSTVVYRNGIILNGGTLQGGAGDGSKRPVVMLEQVTAPSSINQSIKAIDIGVSGTPIDLGGNTLSVSIASSTYFRWYGSLENTTGKFVSSGAGYFTDFPENAPTVDLDLSSEVHFQNAVHVRDYRAATNKSNADGNGSGCGLYVSGVYTPVGDYYYGCIMEDGATIDLSERTGSFNVRSGLTRDASSSTEAQKFARKTVQFADDATVYVKVGDRELDRNTALIAWDSTTRPSNLSTLRFVFADGDYAGRELVKRSTGVYPFPNGLIIILN